MAIAFDAVNSGSAAPATSTFGFTHTTSGSNRALFLGIKLGQDAVTGVTYNGKSMTQLVKKSVNNSSTRSTAYIYGLLLEGQVATGTFNGTISLTGSLNIDEFSVSYTGVLQSQVLPDASGSFQSTSGLTTITATTSATVANNCWAAAFFYGDANPAGVTANSGGVLRGTPIGSGSNNANAFMDSNANIPASTQYAETVNMSTSTENAAVIVSFAPAAAAAVVSNNLRMMMGIGK